MLETVKCTVGLAAFIVLVAMITVISIVAVYGCYLAFSEGGTNVGLGVVCTFGVVLWTLARQGCFQRRDRDLTRQY
jgi:amino acid transporter